MTERERWIVYPLLFLALGAALRDKLFDRTWSRNMVCEHLVLVETAKDRPTKPSLLGVMGRAQPGTVGAVSQGGQLMIDVVRARTVIADNFQYQGIPLRPTLRLVPSLRPPDPAGRVPLRPPAAPNPAPIPAPDEGSPAETPTEASLSDADQPSAVETDGPQA